MAGQDRQQRGPKNVAPRGRVGAGVMQRAGSDQVLEQARRLQKRDKEPHLTRRCDGHIRIPVDAHPATIGVDGHWLITWELNQWSLTFQVPPGRLDVFRHG